MRSFPRFSVVIVAVTALAACSHKDDSGNTVVIRSPSADSAPRALGAGDVKIVAADGGVDLALLGDTISSGLSEQTLTKAKQGTDTAAVKGSGFGASIEKMVKSTVQGALGTRLGFPLSEVKDARYENGRIEFDWTGKPNTLFDHSNVNKKPLLESFSAVDARRFVDAVNARKKGAL